MSELDRPTLIRVGPHYYSFEVSNEVIAERLLTHNVDHLGFTDHRALRIVVRSDLAKTVEKAVVIHELLHALVSVATNNDLLNFELEESLVGALEALTLEVIQDNPDLFAWLASSPQ